MFYGRSRCRCCDARSEGGEKQLKKSHDECREPMLVTLPPLRPRSFPSQFASPCPLLPPAALVRIVPPHAFPAAPLLLAITVAKPPPVLLVPGTQRLAPKREVIIFNDRRLHPRMRGGVYFAR